MFVQYVEIRELIGPCLYIIARINVGEATTQKKIVVLYTFNVTDGFMKIMGINIMTHATQFKTHRNNHIAPRGDYYIYHSYK